MPFVAQGRGYLPHNPSWPSGPSGPPPNLKAYWQSAKMAGCVPERGKINLLFLMLGPSSGGSTRNCVRGSYGAFQELPLLDAQIVLVTDLRASIRHEPDDGAKAVPA